MKIQKGKKQKIKVKKDLKNSKKKIKVIDSHKKVII
jgi:hypothetical protein